MIPLDLCLQFYLNFKYPRSLRYPGLTVIEETINKLLGNSK